MGLLGSERANGAIIRKPPIREWFNRSNKVIGINKRKGFL
jgi:hypothetical protein